MLADGGLALGQTESDENLLTCALKIGKIADGGIPPTYETMQAEAAEFAGFG
jgi:hypothetical protein